MEQTSVQTNSFLTFLPYIATIICSIVSGIVSYIISRKQTKADMKKLERQYQLDLDAEHERFKMEKEKMEIDHKNQLELKEKEWESKSNGDLLNTLLSNIMTMPEMRQMLAQEIAKKNKWEKH